MATEMGTANPKAAIHHYLAASMWHRSWRTPGRSFNICITQSKGIKMRCMLYTVFSSWFTLIGCATRLQSYMRLPMEEEGGVLV